MKYIFLLAVSVAVYSCSNEKPFVNHKLEYKQNGDCTTGEKNASMISNLAGERYIFEACLDENFNGKEYAVERMGDSLVVSFTRTNAPKKAFTVTLDIDAFPVYNYIVLDGKEAIRIQHKEQGSY